MRVHNAAAKVLTQRAGNAGQAIVADTRHKIVGARKGKGSYRRERTNHRSAATND